MPEVLLWELNQLLPRPGLALVAEQLFLLLRFERQPR
jgi:hypothetical protein